MLRLLVEKIAEWMPQFEDSHENRKLWDPWGASNEVLQHIELIHHELRHCSVHLQTKAPLEIFSGRFQSITAARWDDLIYMLVSCFYLKETFSYKQIALITQVRSVLIVWGQYPVGNLMGNTRSPHAVRVQDKVAGKTRSLGHMHIDNPQQPQQDVLHTSHEGHRIALVHSNRLGD